ncbi:MAG: T9SS type A sorting domain-containing protein [Bacteroidales bacterium]|jgi:hypothetical protein|nr:T9SS type A sorting domain-containing protein [Bacteroidales bacterium]
MKKFYFLMVALFICSAIYSQEGTTYSDDNDYLGRDIPKGSTKVRDEGGLWYCYPIGLAGQYSPGSQALPTNYIKWTLKDTLLYDNHGSYGRVQPLSVGQVYDFRETTFWHYWFLGSMMNALDESEHPIDGIQNYSYDLQAVRLQAGYVRGRNVPVDVVDTLVIAIAVKNNLEFQLNYRTDGVTPYSWQPIIPWDRNTGTITIPNNFEKFQIYKYPFSHEDTTGLTATGYYWTTYTFDIDDPQFKGLTPDEQIVVTYTFLSGNPYSINDTMGKQVSWFVFRYGLDPRTDEGYFMNCNVSGFPLPQVTQNENSTAINAYKWSYNPNSMAYYYQRYIPISMWCNETQRHYMSVYLNNLVPLVEGISPVKKNAIKIAPNPASTDFEVTLSESGNADVQLFNLVGQQLLQTSTQEQVFSINTTQYNAGTYLLKIIQNGKVHTSKVIVK